MPADCEYSLGSIWPDDLWFKVPVSGGPYINEGGQYISLPSQFEGWKVRVLRNNVPVDYEDQGEGDPYYTQDVNANTVYVSAVVVEGEKFSIQAYKPAQ